MGYSLCMMTDFQNCLISQIFGVFRAVFAESNSKLFVEWILTCFFVILIFDPKRGLCMGYSLCMMAAFQNGLTSRIFGVFSSSFLHRTILNDL